MMIKNTTTWAGGMIAGLILATSAQLVLAQKDTAAVPVAAGGGMLYACVNNASGTLKLVSIGATCGDNETRVAWASGPAVAPAPVTKPKITLRLNPETKTIPPGGTVEADVVCGVGEMATGFVTNPLSPPMTLTLALPMAEAGRLTATDGYRGGSLAKGPPTGSTPVGFRFYAKNNNMGPWTGAFGGALCLSP